MAETTTDSHVVTTKTTYRTTSSAAPRSLIITRTGGKPSTGGDSFSTVTRTSTTRRSGGPGAGDAAFTEGAYATLTATGVNEVKSARDQEKKEMQDLNDRFADYISKVRNLEAQNRHLANELDKLTSKWGKETSQIKAMYQAELDDARRALDDAEKEKARLEIRVATLEDLIEELQTKLALALQELATNKEKVALQTRQISEYEQEIQLLRRQLDGLENEKEKDQKLIAQLQESLTRAREDLDCETLAHVDTENRRQTLEEQIEFLKCVHDQEMSEMAALANRDSQPDSRDFWKQELTQAVNEIRQMYDDKLEAMRTQLESSYTVKMQDMRNAATKQSVEVTKSKEDCSDLRANITDIRAKINDLEMQNMQLAREIETLRRSKDDRERELETENAAMRAEANSLKSEMDSIMQELQAIMHTKMGLELEISAYRKLLESEETRIEVRSSLMSSLMANSKQETQEGS